MFWSTTNQSGRFAAAVLGFAVITGAASASVSLQDAAGFAVLGLGGTSSAFGNVTINSATSIIGDVGYGAYIQSTTNQKVDLFIGRALAHESATFNYTAATYQPTLGIAVGGGADATNTRLNAATAAVLNAGNAFAVLPTSLTLGTVNGNTVVNSTGDLNVISVSNLSMNSNVLTLNSRPGFTDTFVFNVSGNFDFSQSQVQLVGTTASRVLFNFTGDNAAITINKASTVFSGTLLAPKVGQSIIYHNPASFTGAIYGYNITLHSDFNLNYSGFIPAPGAAGLLALSGLFAARRRR